MNPTTSIFLLKNPSGLTLRKQMHFTKKIEDEIVRIIKPYKHAVESFIAQVGEGASDPNQMSVEQETPNKSRIAVSFVEFEYREGVDTRR
jgi:multidrug efflux pump